MNPTIEQWLIVIALLGAGVMAGLFFAFSVFVMQALGKLPASAGMAAMQNINETILRPLFFLVFLGTAVICLALLTSPFWSSGGRSAQTLTLTACLAYLVGNIAVTAFFNVPLNNRLAANSPDSADGQAVWRDYQHTWLRWNHLRTVSCSAAVVCFALALIQS